jgi:hypothetical protein
MAKTRAFEGFTFAPGDPLAGEHATVSACVEEAVASLRGQDYYRDADLKTLPSGKAVLDGKPEQARRYVLAAVAQAGYWDRLAERIRSRGADDFEHDDPRGQPDWRPVWGRRRQAVAVIGALMRRNLPFNEEDLIAIVRWCAGSEPLSSVTTPIGSIVRALQRYAAETPIGPGLRDEMKSLAAKLRSSHDKEARRHGTAVEQLGAEAAARAGRGSRAQG